MGRAVLAVAHGIVSEHKDGGQLHQGREPNGRPRIVTEDEERGAEGAKLRQCESVDGGCHRMLADAEMQVPAAGSARLEVSGALEREQRLGGGAEIRRSPEKPGNVLRENIENLARGIATGDAFRVGGKNRQPLIPSSRQLAPLHQLDLGRELRMFRAISRKQLSPTPVGLSPARADSRGQMLARGVGNEKLRVLGPSVGAFDKANLFLAQWLAVRRRSVLSMRRAVADVAVQNDENRTPLRVVKDVQSVLDAINVVGIAHAQNVPAITQKSGRDVLRKGDACVAFDGDVVVVIDPAEIVQGEMARQ